MPTYEYECPEHGHFESVHSIKSIPASVSCPQCGHDSPKAFCRPETFLLSYIPGFQRPGAMSTTYSPQYGVTDSMYKLLGKEQRSLEYMNSHQSTDRWQINRSVKDGGERFA